MKDEYLDVKQDLYGAFVVRGIDLAAHSGLLAIVVGDTWMSIKSFEAMRVRLLNGHAFDSFVHMRDVSNHPDIFGANAAFVLSMDGKRYQPAPFIRLEPLGQERKEQDLRVALKERTAEAGFHLASGDDFAMLPGTPIVYWLSEKMRGIFTSGDRLGAVASLAVGLQTGENNRFLRQWWEVSQVRSALTCTSREEAAASGARWFPYNKGGEFRKWYGNQEHVVNWENDGAEIVDFKPRSVIRNPGAYFSPSVSWSDISSGAPSFRSFPEGFIHGNKGNSLFGASGLLVRLLGVMNASCASVILGALTPTMTASVGDVGKTPIPDALADLQVSGIEALVTASKADWNQDETAWGFESNPLVTPARSERFEISRPRGYS